MIRRLLLLLALCAVATASPAAETARAWLDRDSLQLGETVTLNVESSESGAEPDFSALEADFELLGRSSSSSVSIANGRTTSSMLWAIGLRPRREGKFTIAPLSVGKARTEPITVTVGAAPAVAAAAAGDDVFLEVTADPQLVYVQQQVRVTVRFYYAVNLTDGAVEELSLADAVVQKLGQDRSYDAERSGRRYRVMERRYALTAQKSGSLAVPALNFRGRALSGNDPNALFFGRGRAVSTRSEPVTIEVKPRPAGSGGGAWLPAQSLQLQVDGLTAATPARVGEPLTLTVTEIAQGLGFEQLPEIELPAIDGAEVYPDKSVTRSRENAGWVVGERSRKFAIVPKRAGKLQIPALSLDWWNAADDAAARATTEAIALEVAEAVAAPATPATVPAVASEVPAPASDGAGFWRLAAIASFVLWLLTFAALLWQRRPRRVAPAATAPVFSPTRRSFERAVADGDAAAA
ncbi:BatD family protein, partial [Tahibacter caeni]|uniref:BatD family protein n=1 Tax=Tahibacter caeni TaxID=1453545 RepID=UPI002147F6A9